MSERQNGFSQQRVLDTLRGKCRRFHDDEQGVLIIFALFIFVLMLAIGGMALDVSRFETTRTRLQNTVDRAVLAAADLDQPLPPADVVEDYFDKAGLGDFLTSVSVEDGLNYRVVNAVAGAQMKTWFLPNNVVQPPAEYGELLGFVHSMGELPLSVITAGTAEERVTDVEISLVVDVSGSMTRDNRLVNLKVAAQEFIDTVIPEPDPNVSDEGLTTLSIVPYSAVVNIGPDLADEITLSSHHNYSTCPLFTDDMFDTTALDLGVTYERVAHFEYGGSSTTPINNPWCPTTNNRGTGRKNEVIPLSEDKDYLKEAIRDLSGYGNTAIDLGMKWGAALLDPSLQPVVTGLVADGVVIGDADGRPADMDDLDTLKVVVLMTDGANTTEYDLSDDVKGASSDVWIWRQYPGQPIREVPRNRTSIRIDTNGTPDNLTDDTFFHLDTRWDQRIRSYPKGFPGYDDFGNTNTGDANALVSRLSWQDLYAYSEYRYINNWYLREAYDRGYVSYNEYMEPEWAMEAKVNGSQADDRLSEVCAAARNERIVIFTIAFEAPNAGQAALQDCASSLSHYYNVSGTDISEAFESIASQINQLRLTQ